MKKVLFDAVSEYSRYRVVDLKYNGRKARVLFGDDDSPQSGIAFDRKPELLFNYNQRMLEIAESIRPSAALVIGGGAFTLPTALWQRFETTNIDVVEIDPLLPELAKEYFGLTTDSRLNVIVQDGLEYVYQTKQQYDFIAIDAFRGLQIEHDLLTAVAAEQYASRLALGGVVALNFTAYPHSADFAQCVKNFQTAFSVVDVYQADYRADKQANQNLVLVAANHEISLDYLQSASV